MFTIGSVPYVNARPLVHYFEAMGADSPVKVLYDVPSNLPKLLDSGAVDAVLVSSFDALTHPGRRMAMGVCIGSRGAIESVRLFSKVPFEQISTLALDQSSLTSNHLAQLILAQKYNCRPICKAHSPNLKEMLHANDAALLIGDIGMTASAEGLHVMDLGEDWQSMTGLPFVWAAWIGNERLTSELASLLSAAYSWSENNIDLVCQEALRDGWEALECKRYLTEVVRYQLSEEELLGMRTYGDLLLQNGVANAKHLPALVYPDNGQKEHQVPVAETIVGM